MSAWSEALPVTEGKWNNIFKEMFVFIVMQLSLEMNISLSLSLFFSWSKYVFVGINNLLSQIS